MKYILVYTHQSFKIEDSVITRLFELTLLPKKNDGP
jgi:hypothetical protein